MSQNHERVQTVMGEFRLAYGVAELAAKTATSIPFIRKEIRRGHLKASKVSRRVLVTTESVREWLASSVTGK
jgi:excisionase family DNA binding protein